MSERLCADLPEDKIREYCACQPIARLSLFGSTARNELTPESDVDLMVECLPGARIGYFELAQQEIDLSELIGSKVDLRTPNELSLIFRQQVVDNARLLYVRGS